MPLNWKDNTGYNQVNLGGGALVVADHILAGINPDPTKSTINGSNVPAYLFNFVIDTTSTIYSISSGVSQQSFTTHYSLVSKSFNSLSSLSATLVTTLSSQSNNFVKSEFSFNANVSLNSALYSNLVQGTNHYQIQVSTHTKLGGLSTTFANTFGGAYAFNASSPALTDNFYSSFTNTNSTYTFTSSYTISTSPFSYSTLGVPSEISLFICNKSF